MIDSELILADLASAEGALAKQKKKDGGDVLTALLAVQAALEGGVAVRNMGKKALPIEQWAALRPYQFLTAKPLLYVANLGEDGGEIRSKEVSGALQKLRAHAEGQGARVVELSARLEGELAGLDSDADREEFLEMLELKEENVDGDYLWIFVVNSLSNRCC